MGWKYYRFSSLPAAEVGPLAEERSDKLHANIHPFVLGNECDMSCGPGDERDSLGKVEAVMPTPT
jgi:hypothetical protein